ncbi:MAG: hypothetical protein K8R59_07085 [Thermoanaerobaculales bacterium]|nr:hypothetical protein [Thermoanaerobaculales bacterium]
MLVLIPVHLVAFVVLYFGLVRVMRGEMLRTHSIEARALLTEAVHTLHPMMCSRDHAVISVSAGEFAEKHSLLDFRLYRADGSLMGRPMNPIPRITHFLEGTEEENFSFEDHGNVLALKGILRVRSEGDCAECHDSGLVLGAATMSMDLTPEVTGAQDRLENNLTYLVIGWALMVGFVNIGIGAWTRRSLKEVRRLENQASLSDGISKTQEPGIFLDPVAAELYRSLAKVLRRQQEEKEAVSDRFHHTERLASLGRLAAGLAHEIKNPLAGIRGVMELMRDDTEDEDQRDLFKAVVGELDKVNEIIHLLLNFARPAPPKRENADIAELLEDSLQFLRPPLRKKSIDLKIEVARDVGSFFLDVSQLRHVVNNLVANAADAIGSDGTIVVRASLLPEDEGMVVSVEDDGPGIPEGVIDEVFEPFYTTKFSGTGLGLSVVRSLVAQHGGRVELESNEGVGTTFFVILPNESPRTEVSRDESVGEGKI